MGHNLCKQQSQTRAIKATIQDVVKQGSVICNEMGKEFMQLAESIIIGPTKTGSVGEGDRSGTCWQL
jgi:hypothetical protein